MAPKTTLFTITSRFNNYVAHVGGACVSVSKVKRLRSRWRSVLFPRKKRPVQMQHFAAFHNSFRSPITAVAWSANERILLAGGTHGELIGWDVPTRSQILAVKRFRGYSAIEQIAIDPTGRLFAACTPLCVQVWEITAGRRRVKCRRLAQILITGGAKERLSWSRDVDVLWLGRDPIWQR